MKTLKSIILLLVILFVLEFSVQSLHKIEFLKNSSVKVDDIQEESSINEYYFACSDNTEGAFVYDKTLGQAALIIGQDVNILFKSDSNSGNQYTSPDGSIVFWENGVDAYVEVNGMIVHEECSLTPIENLEI